MVRKVELAFNPKGFMLPLERILPLRKVPQNIRDSEKYGCIRASIREVGLIEPLIVYPQKGGSREYLLLDGAIRLDVLKEAGETEAFCLEATEDEACTYNHKVNRLSPIQEHFMIMKALENGVPEKRIAATLSVDVAEIRRKRDLLTGICPEAVALLKDKRISSVALREVKRVVPLRQVEMAELMIAINNFSASYAKCLFTGTPQDQCLPNEVAKEDCGFTPEDVARMQREMTALHRDMKLIEETHGENCLNLVPAVGYLRKLLGNARVERYLLSHYPDMLEELRKIVDEPELGPTGEQAA